MSPFAKQVTLAADRSTPGRYTLDVDSRWNCPVVPQGGMMAAIAARAMADELADPSQTLRSLTTVFAAQVPAGPVTVDVSVLRRGRSMSQALATVRAAGAADAGHTTVAVFGQPRPGFEFTDVSKPDVPPPLECPSFRDPLPEEAGEFEPRVLPFWENVEGRAALGHAPWEDYAPTSSDCVNWYRFDEPPMLPDGTLDPLAVVALSDLMPSSVGERMGPGTPMWYPPSADLTVHLFGKARSEWVLAHLRSRRATDGYASVECALWDEPGQLVAHAAQVMFMSFPDGPPTPEQRVPFDRRS